MPEWLSCGFPLLLWRHFLLLEEMMWFTSSFLSLSHVHFGFLWEECEWLCVCVPVCLHTFSTAHSLCEITSRPLLRVCDRTTEKQLLNTDLTTPSNMSLVKRCWAQNNTLIRGNSQVNENEPLTYQTDIWCNISAVVNNWNSWKSPLRKCWQVARRLRVQKPQSGVVDTPIFLHLLRCSAARSG